MSVPRQSSAKGFCGTCGKLVPISDNTRTPSGLMCAGCRAEVGSLGGDPYIGSTVANLSEFHAARLADATVARAEFELALGLALREGWA